LTWQRAKLVFEKAASFAKVVWETDNFAWQGRRRE